MGWLGWFGWPTRKSRKVTDADTAFDLNALPQDAFGSNSLDAWHLAVCRAFETHALAPITKPTRILDVACGTGRWAREMARMLPTTWVVGVDIDGRQIDRALEEGAWRGDDLLPPNCQLVQGNALSRFPYADGTFDYAHGRFLSAFVPRAQWGQLVREMKRVTRPGGWVELVDTAGFSSPVPACDYLQHCLRSLYEHDGLRLEPGPALEGYLKEAELRHVYRQGVAAQATASRYGVGRVLVSDLLNGMVQAAPAYVRAGIASEAQVRAAVERVRRDAAAVVIRISLMAAWGQVA